MPVPPLALVGGAVGAAWLMERRRAGESFRSPEREIDPAATGGLRELAGKRVGDVVLSAEGRNAAGIYSDQRRALLARYGALSVGTIVLPRLTLAQASAWLDAWAVVAITWRRLAHEVGQVAEAPDVWLPRLEAADTLLKLAVRYRKASAWPMAAGLVVAATVREARDAILGFATQITTSAGDLVPYPPDRFASAWDAAAAASGYAVDRVIVRPLSSVATAVGGVVAGAAVDLGGVVLGSIATSPVGAALLLFGAWRLTRA